MTVEPGAAVQDTWSRNMVGVTSDSEGPMWLDWRIRGERDERRGMLWAQWGLWPLLCAGSLLRTGVFGGTLSDLTEFL